MAEITAELVAVERRLWEGKATQVTAVTTEGEIGILPGHQPLLGQLVNNGTVSITTPEGEKLYAAVEGGFISVSSAKISILADRATWADEVDVAKAEADANSDDEEVKARAQGQLLAAKRASGR